MNLDTSSVKKRFHYINSIIIHVVFEQHKNKKKLYRLSSCEGGLDIISRLQKSMTIMPQKLNCIIFISLNHIYVKILFTDAKCIRSSDIKD